MAVVCCDKSHSDFVGDTDKVGNDTLLFLDPVILQFNIEVLFAEEVAVILRLLLGALVIARGQLSRDLARKTGREAYQALVILLKKAVVYARL